jgi:hypothetical protein
MKTLTQIETELEQMLNGVRVLKLAWGPDAVLSLAQSSRDALAAAAIEQPVKRGRGRPRKRSA